MRNNSKRRVIIGVIAAVLMIVLLYLALRFIESRGLLDEQFGDTGGWGDEPPEEQILSIGETDYITMDNIEAYMLVGTDNGGEDLGDGYNGELADFITVVLIDNTTEKYGFYQIDRNTMVEVAVPDYASEETDEDSEEDASADEDEEAGAAEPGTFLEQICIAHWYGKTAEERNNNLANAVSELLGGIQIDGYYVLNMKDIGSVNNAIGGVTVTIEDDMTGIDPAFAKGASVLLSDSQAEKYLRARMSLKDDSNSARMKRHQQYMQNAYNMLIGQLRENPEYINDLYDRIEPLIQSDGEIKLSKLTNQLVEYTGQGILKFEGKSRKADTLGDGKEHEEFYPEQKSIVTNLKKVIDMARDDE